LGVVGSGVELVTVTELVMEGLVVGFSVMVIVHTLFGA
jgi:hypothetical protein